MSLRFAQTATLLAATVTTGLTAGLFYSFACAVMPGLRHAADRYRAAFAPLSPGRTAGQAGCAGMT